MKEIYFIRHGESEAQIANLEQKDAKDIHCVPLDKHISLTKKGFKQSIELIRKINKIINNTNIESQNIKIYSSDYKRAIQTAKPTEKLLKKKIITNQLLREQDQGFLDPYYMEHFPELHPYWNDYWKRRQKAFSTRITEPRFLDGSPNLGFEIKNNDGEPWDVISNRIKFFVEYVLTKDSVNIIFTHSGLIWATKNAILNTAFSDIAEEMNDFYIPNTSITHYTTDNNNKNKILNYFGL